MQLKDEQSGKLAHRSAVSQIAQVVFIILIVVAALLGYLVGHYQEMSQPRITTTMQQVSNSTTTVTSTHYQTNAISSTTITWTQYQTNIVSQNDSINNLMVANMTLIGPNSISINQKTDIVYIEYGSNTTNLAVINGTTDSLITSILLGTATQATPVINPDTNTVYIGDAIINGTSNRVLSYVNSDITFVGADPNKNIVYAMSTSNGRNASTMIYEMNGTDNKLVGSLSFPGYPEAGDNPVAMNTQTGVLYLSVCSTECGFSEQYIIGIGAASSGLQVVAEIPVNKLIFNIAVNPTTNMIYATALQNLFIAINGTTNQVVDEIPVTAYANELSGITVDPLDNEIFLAGSPDCISFSGCGANTLYVLSGLNNGILATFVGGPDIGPFLLQFDSANNQTYVLYYFSHFVASVKIPRYTVTYLVP
ncbi:MAG: YncE family protein [Nitrososphaerales archaeon]